ncbi:enoyl-CoA hydratase-related protein [Amycolatopsis sp. GM8]|uniref:enoyl-CoA hydratase-related protein n=1 Tax=Amycolatopsis sp. GM8 TaxID=2896530 RepID=UPI001F00C4B8|nr:enoyl-CoA hydratase-related protein [Amycolatopsis sp. GM8]
MNHHDHAGGLVTERSRHVLLMTIDRPAARNSINAETARAIGDALQSADGDRDVRAVVITGAGPDAFCAGADLKALSRGQALTPAGQPYASWGFACFTKHAISKPVIAAVNGYALGGGFEIVLACDLVVASDTATFGFPEVKRGVLARGGGAFRAVQQMPVKRAMEYLLTGRDITAAEAMDAGLINRVVSADQVVPAALEMAHEISANAPLAVQATKRIARGMADGDIAAEQAAWCRTEDEALALTRSRDYKEGPAAFAEGRKPNWSGE